jgi:uncharacterized protein YjbI with pentapeptide repeats
MADQSHLDILAQGVKVWNMWRGLDPSILAVDPSQPDLSRADLREANLREANLRGANLEGANLVKANLLDADLQGANLLRADLIETELSGANLHEANLFEADLSDAKLVYAKLSGANVRFATLPGAHLGSADLSGTDFSGAMLFQARLPEADLSKAILIGANLLQTDLKQAILRQANLSGAQLSEANLHTANLTEANLTRADLSSTSLVKADLEGATLTGCRIYGISAWDLNLRGVEQKNLIISPHEQPDVTTDDLEVAQFIYLLYDNKKIRNVIDTISSKVVLILGRFTSEREAVLEAIRDALRQHGYLPVLFNFEGPTSRNLTETISTLAHMARFIIADSTEAKSIPQELQAIVPHLPSVPVQPLLLASENEYGMFEHFKYYPWVLEVYRYEDTQEILTSLEAKIITPAEDKARELSRQ